MLMTFHLLRRQVGELFIATIAKSGGELRAAQVKAAQKERETALAVQLIALLKRYVYGDEEGFPGEGFNGNSIFMLDCM